MAENPAAKFALMRGKSPDEATMFWSGGPVEAAERIWFQSQFSGVTAFETDEGIVLVHTGLKRLAPALAAMLRQKTNAPIHTAIYTHGHIDHAYGLEALLAPRQRLPRVIGHRAMPARLARYQATAGHNAAINARQFGGTVEAQTNSANRICGEQPIAPGTLYDDQMEIEVGGVRFELHHCKGETDDHTWVWCPDRSVVCPGDLFIWAVPNDGNPQKVQRYPWDRAKGLRAMAALEPRVFCPGHGGPIAGDAAKIQRMLIKTEAAILAREGGYPSIPRNNLPRNFERNRFLPRARGRGTAEGGGGSGRRTVVATPPSRASPVLPPLRRGRTLAPKPKGGGAPRANRNALKSSRHTHAAGEMHRTLAAYVRALKAEIAPVIRVARSHKRVFYAIVRPERCCVRTRRGSPHAAPADLAAALPPKGGYPPIPETTSGGISNTISSLQDCRGGRRLRHLQTPPEIHSLRSRISTSPQRGR